MHAWEAFGYVVGQGAQPVGVQPYPGSSIATHAPSHCLLGRRTGAVAVLAEAAARAAAAGCRCCPSPARCPSPFPFPVPLPCPLLAAPPAAAPPVPPRACVSPGAARPAGEDRRAGRSRATRAPERADVDGCARKTSPITPSSHTRARASAATGVRYAPTMPADLPPRRRFLLAGASLAIGAGAWLPSLHFLYRASPGRSRPGWRSSRPGRSTSSTT